MGKKNIIKTASEKNLDYICSMFIGIIILGYLSIWILIFYPFLLMSLILIITGGIYYYKLKEINNLERKEIERDSQIVKLCSKLELAFAIIFLVSFFFPTGYRINEFQQDNLLYNSYYYHLSSIIGFFGIIFIFISIFYLNDFRINPSINTIGVLILLLDLFIIILETQFRLGQSSYLRISCLIIFSLITWRLNGYKTLYSRLEQQKREMRERIRLSRAKINASMRNGRELDLSPSTNYLSKTHQEEIDNLDDIFLTIGKDQLDEGLKAEKREPIDTSFLDDIEFDDEMEKVLEKAYQKLEELEKNGERESFIEQLEAQQQLDGEREESSIMSERMASNDIKAPMQNKTLERGGAGARITEKHDVLNLIEYQTLIKVHYESLFKEIISDIVEYNFSTRLVLNLITILKKDKADLNLKDDERESIKEIIENKIGRMKEQYFQDIDVFVNFGKGKKMFYWEDLGPVLQIKTLEVIKMWFNRIIREHRFKFKVSDKQVTILDQDFFNETTISGKKSHIIELMQELWRHFEEWGGEVSKILKLTPRIIPIGEFKHLTDSIFFKEASYPSILDVESLRRLLYFSLQNRNFKVINKNEPDFKDSHEFLACAQEMNNNLTIYISIHFIEEKEGTRLRIKVMSKNSEINERLLIEFNNEVNTLLNQLKKLTLNAS